MKMTSSGMLHRIAWYIITVMMKAISSSETSVNIYQTAQCNIPEEDSHLQVYITAVNNAALQTECTDLLFWFVTPYGLAGKFQRFGYTYCLHLKP
jgi:hypothetical protein